MHFTVLCNPKLQKKFYISSWFTSACHKGLAEKRLRTNIRSLTWSWS